MTIFLDTNVILDWILDRKDTYAEEATRLFEASENNKITLYVSSGSIYTLVYVLYKSGKRGVELQKSIADFLEFVEIEPTHKKSFVEASKGSYFKDMEDTFQYHTALQNTKISYFVTGNLKDFKDLQILLLPVVTPLEMINILY